MMPRLSELRARRSSSRRPCRCRYSYETKTNSRVAALQGCETRGYPCIELTIVNTGHLTLVFPLRPCAACNKGRMLCISDNNAAYQ